MTEKKNSQRKRKNTSPTPQYNEEMSMEMLAEHALAETLREGGAFARQNNERFKQQLDEQKDSPKTGEFSTLFHIIPFNRNMTSQ